MTGWLIPPSRTATLPVWGPSGTTQMTTRRSTGRSFVVTHRPKAVVTKQGGTTSRFVTDGLHAAVAQARATAGDVMSSYSAAGPACSARWTQPDSRSSGPR
jgi:hypothetical protein